MQLQHPQLPQAVSEILARLNHAGFAAYLVGGSVRDLCMDRIPNDFDMTTSAKPEEIRACFSDCPVIETGIRHGTVTVLWQGKPYEITTYRVDGVYEDHRHPKTVTFTDSLTADLARRDFTVNAMAWHPKEGLQDPFFGQDDIAAQTVRCVGNPDRRFQEDGLRILRAVRFASVLGFRLEAETERAVFRNRRLLQEISAERIAVEWKKALCGISAQTVLRRYGAVFAEFLPEFPNDSQVLSVFDAVENDLIARMTAFFYPCAAETVRAALLRLKFDRETLRRVCEATAFLNAPLPTVPAEIRRATGEFGFEAMRRVFRLRALLQPEMAEECENALRTVQRAQAENACLSLRQLAVGGDALRQIGIRPGKEMGETLRSLLDAVLDEKCANTEAALLAYAKSHR